MDGDPFASMVALMRAQGGEDSAQAGLGAAPARMRLGRVVSAAPLSVSVAGLVQPAGALRVNERLVKGARWRARITSPSGGFKGLSGPISGPVSTPHGQGSLSQLTGGEVHSTDAVLDEAQVEQLELDLAAGDEVLLLTQDDQIFYIIMKVARAV